MVTGSKYYSKVVRQGSRPSNTGEVVGEVPSVLNPDPNNNPTSYLGLTDTDDTTYNGKNGYVPVVIGESQLKFQPLPQIPDNGLISGGIVQWTGIGYVFNISGAFYRIGGVPYSSDPDQVTLSAPDATNDRIDVFAVDINGDVVVIEGTPAATPVKPQIDPQTQLELTSVIVTASTTEPVLTEEVIYDENVEWTGSSTGTGTVVFNSAVDPYQGSLSIEATNIENGLKIRLTDGSDYDLSTVQTLGMQINLKASMFAGQNIGVTFLDSLANPISSELILNHDKSITGYQFVGIALSQFSFTSFNARSIEFRFIRTKGAQVYSGFFLDIIKLEGGINPPQTVGSFTGLNDTPNSYSGQGGKTVAVKADESGLEFVTGGSGGVASVTGDGVDNTDPANPVIDLADIAVSGSPYDLDQEGATDGQVLTWVNANSRYEPVTPSGGGGNFIAYDVAQALSGSQRQQALDNIGSSSGSLETFNNTGSTTLNDLVITKSNIEFSGASTVILNGIVPLWEGQELILFNRTGNNLTITRENAGSSALNRIFGAIVIPTAAGIRLKYSNVNGALRWSIIGNSWFIDQSGFGSSTYENLGVNQPALNNIGLTIQNVSGSTFAFATEDSSGNRTFEIRESSVISYSPTGIGGSSAGATRALTIRSISGSGWPLEIFDFAGTSRILFFNNGNIGSRGKLFLGASSSFVTATATLDVRGSGTTTGLTQIWEDSAGTNNVEFVDNGQVRMLRLPTSSAGLVSGSLWNDSGTLKIV